MLSFGGDGRKLHTETPIGDVAEGTNMCVRDRLKWTLPMKLFVSYAESRE